MRLRSLAAPLPALGALPLAALVLACSSPPPAGDPRPPAGADPSTAAETSSPAPAAQVSPDELLQQRLRAAVTHIDSSALQFPVVVVEGTNITLDGAPAGSVVSVGGSFGLQKVHELFVQLKATRETWKAAHPDAPFPGVVGLRASPDAPMVAFKSAFQTVAYAGYPRVFVQSATEPAAIVEVMPQIPQPPGTLLGLPEPSAPPPPALHLHVHDDVRLTWTNGSAVLSEATLPLGAPGLAETLCTGWKARRSGRAPAEPDRDQLLFSVDNRHPAGLLPPLFRAVEACTRDVRARDGTTTTVPVFEITLSVR